MISPSERQPLMPRSSNKIEKKKKGPPPKKISERSFDSAAIKPIRGREISWSQAQKVRVLTFLTHHHIPIAPDIRLPVSHSFTSLSTSTISPLSTIFPT